MRIFILLFVFFLIAQVSLTGQFLKNRMLAVDGTSINIDNNRFSWHDKSIATTLQHQEFKYTFSPDTTGDGQSKIFFDNLIRKFSINNKVVKRKEFMSILKTVPKAYDTFRSGNNHIALSYIVGVPGSFILGWNIGLAMSNRLNRKTWLIYSSAITLGSIIWYYHGIKLKKRGLALFNNRRKTSLGLNLGSNGLGLAFTF